MKLQMPSIPLKFHERYGDESLVRSIPKKFWPAFLDRFLEGVRSYLPPPDGRRMYWRIDRAERDIDLVYIEGAIGEATEYYEKVVAQPLGFFLTKRDWDQRFRQILDDSS